MDSIRHPRTFALPGPGFKPPAFNMVCGEDDLPLKSQMPANFVHRSSRSLRPKETPFFPFSANFCKGLHITDGFFKAFY
jgi:hypothetical protein